MKIIDDKLKKLKKCLPKPFKLFIKKLIFYLIVLEHIFKLKLYRKILNDLIDFKKIKGIIIYLPAIDWKTTLFQRPHQLAIEFSKINYLFLFITPNSVDNIQGLHLIMENLILTNLPLNLLIGILKNESKIPKIIYISLASNKFLISYSIKKNVDIIMYDYIDELEVFSQYNKKFEKDHLFLVKNADILLVTADRLLSNIEKIRKDIVLCPNGVDYQHFSTSQKIYEIPNELIEIVNKKLIIGYHGALADWIDYELIKYIAFNIKNSQIILIGPNYDNSIYKSKILNINNINWFGPKKYEDLPKHIKYFDVAILPFKINNITKSTSPIKMFEYMAAGVPIVSVDLPEPKKYKSVLIAKNYDDFVDKIFIAKELKMDENYLKLLDKEAKENSWENRAKLIDELIQYKLNEKRKK